MARIAIVTTSHWPAAGGAQIYQRLLSLELSRRHRVTVLAQRRHSGPTRPSTFTYGQRCFDTYRDGDVTVRCVGPERLDRFRLLPFFLLHVSGRMMTRPRLRSFLVSHFTHVYGRRLRRLLCQFDLVHTFKTTYLGGACMKMAQEMDLPCVATPLIHPGWWLDDPFTMRQLRVCDSVFAMLEYDRAYMIKHGVSPESVHAIGAPFDTLPQGDPQAFRRQYGLEGCPVICFSGVKRAHKGYDKLLEAAPSVWRTFPEARFLFVGLRTEHSRRVFSGTTDSRIVELGHVDAQEKNSAMAACDIFCLPSASESFGIVFLEAWHMGKPVIAADIPSSRELIGGCGGGLTVPQRPEAIGTAILDLLNHPEKRHRMATNGRAKLRQYTVEEIGRRVQNVYDTLLSKSL